MSCAEENRNALLDTLSASFSNLAKTVGTTTSSHDLNVAAAAFGDVVGQYMSHFAQEDIQGLVTQTVKIIEGAIAGNQDFHVTRKETLQ